MVVEHVRIRQRGKGGVQDHFFVFRKQILAPVRDENLPNLSKYERVRGEGAYRSVNMKNMREKKRKCGEIEVYTRCIVLIAG